MNYKQRMLMELIELKTKIVKLDCFDGKPVQSEREITLIECQKKAMEEYYNALEKRLMIALEDTLNNNCKALGIIYR